MVMEVRKGSQEVADSRRAQVGCCFSPLWTLAPTPAPALSPRPALRFAGRARRGPPVATRNEKAVNVDGLQRSLICKGALFKIRAKGLGCIYAGRGLQGADQLREAHELRHAFGDWPRGGAQSWLLLEVVWAPPCPSLSHHSLVLRSMRRNQARRSLDAYAVRRAKSA